MKLSVKIILLIPFFILISLTSNKVDAATLTNAKDTITTSRPSASAPISANQITTDSQVTVLDNGSFYLASDSAKLVADTGQNESIVTVASMSASNTPSAGVRTVYFNNPPAANHHAGTALIVPNTAMHIVEFTVNQAIPSGGQIVITFPGLTNNSASPSATAFAFNGLLTSNVVSEPTSVCNTVTVASPTVTCTTFGAISGGTTITLFIGCSAQVGGVCNTQKPTLINPSKSVNAGTADIWKVSIATKDTPTHVLDNATISIGTIESVTIRANIDPSLTFSISGITNGTSLNSGNTTGCLQSELMNTGVNSTSTEINLGTLSNSPTLTNTTVNNISGQLLTVSTNGANGYIITATSSGKLSNPGTGYSLVGSATPLVFPSNGGNYFGFHACGLDTYNTDIGTTFWNSTASDTNCHTYIGGSTGNICKYGWPSSTTPINIASDTSGPIGNSLTAGNGLTSISYAAGADAGVPPGQYTTVVTYVATPAF